MSELSYPPAAPGADVGAVPGPAGRPGEFVGRSPGQPAWLRLRRDRTAKVSAVTLAVAALVALGAPLLQRLTGIDPTDKFVDRLNDFGMPIGYAGGISSDHWLGLEPGSGRDILMQLVYGLRTSLFIAFASALLASGIGVAVGVLAGWARGWLDSVVNWLIDLTLAFPFLIFALTVIPIRQEHTVRARTRTLTGVLAAAALAAAGCSPTTDGGDDGQKTKTQSGSISYEAADNQGPAKDVDAATRGDTLTVMQPADFDHLDPASNYVTVQQAAGGLLYRSLNGNKEDGSGKLLLVGDVAINPGKDVDGDCKVWEFTLCAGG
ncbi:hypothetical protein [Micromonospora marina]|uniref:hypothetical protein n=1 Tax=Micromonospora marina TaxID=307120 RepID=UPI003452C4D6